MTGIGTQEQLEATFSAIAKHLQSNEGFATRIVQTDVSIGFVVRDLGADVALRFNHGQVSAIPGGAAQATIAITLHSDVLAKILAGQQDPESAYMFGSLSLRGSEYVAEGMVRYYQDLVSAYRLTQGE